ncbi:DUF882 domain-containing protein [Bosea sp. BK604]|uniref:YcbK family protein n=1 Tax=Bosea sp. BK604 TaxID=2512180 RepID=UPI001042EC9C|nr:DUF882 domain-containing protein [Bosea sp. BK604]TCR62643.1 uncharacterized protein DUF882 [Bosea sp. BK604]
MPLPIAAGATETARPAFPLLPLIAFAALVAAEAGHAQQQPPQMVRAPLPPERPFDLDMPTTSAPPQIIIPAPVVPPTPTAPPAARASVAEPPPFTPGEPTPAGPAGPDSPVLSEPDEDEGPEWPQLTPGQKAGAEPAFDPNEKPDKPGISTDPGTSTACLPERLKGILGRIVDKYGAVKVTSTWRPPWRARRGSYHKRCEAMDFRVPGIRPRVVLDYARGLPEVGGHKVYWNGLIHIDTGPRRPW